MKIHFPFILVTLLSFLFFTKSPAQKVNALPGGKVISFNGIFTNPVSEGNPKTFSDNGLYSAGYSIGAVSDENRQIQNFSLYKNEVLVYALPEIPGSDLMLSNSGMVAVFEMNRHPMQEITIHFIDLSGQEFASETFRYASGFGFSPTGNTFAISTSENLQIFNLVKGTTYDLDPCSQFAFSPDEQHIAQAKEDELWVSSKGSAVLKTNTGLFYPRAVAVDPSSDLVAVIGKTLLKAYRITNAELRFEAPAPENCSFRDLLVHDGLVYAGLHDKSGNNSRGILHTYSAEGVLDSQMVLAEKQYKTFETTDRPVKANSDYEAIPWPFEPFDQVHKVWNHYEQHMGDGSGYWSYLHQGLDLEVPINEPTYAVAEGWVKLVLTIGGDAYWRVAISPEQSSGESDGWLYAHLVQGSIQVDVGDYVNLHDYLGDIIYWSDDWGHIHFVNIHDQGEIWYYDDDEWGINFNPLLALTPITDETGPVIEDFSATSKFGFCENESVTYLDPDNLSGEVDIISKISDYHGSSDWEQPAYRTYYWIETVEEGTVVFPKTLGQILNHTYTMYNGTYFEDYAPLMYKKDYLHPSPPWMNHDRDYYQVLTNNNGDSIAEPWETELAFNTMDYYDGSYQLFVEAWDEYGNMAVDSQVITFVNGNISGLRENGRMNNIALSPNPASGLLTISGIEKEMNTVAIFSGQLVKVMELNLAAVGIYSETIQIDLAGLPGGVYYILVESEHHQLVRKVVKL